MNTKASLRGKIKIHILIVIQWFLFITVVFSMIGIIIFLWNSFMGGFQIAYLELALLYIGIFMLLIEAVTYVEKQLKLARPSSKFFSTSYRENLRAFLVPSSIAITAFGAFAVIGMFLGLFPDQVSASLRLEILKTVIQTNGFLIGLTGIVFAQMFWAINNQQNALQIEIIKNPVGYSNVTPEESRDRDIRERHVTALDKRRRDTSISMFVVIGAFMFSIAISLREMARTETYQSGLTLVNPDITTPIFSMIIGIVFFVVFMVGSKMSLTEDDAKP